MRQNEVFQRFVKLGLPEESAITMCEEAISAMEREPDEEDILIKAIKS